MAPEEETISDRGAAARVLATAGLMLATVMQTLDTTIANVALPHMQGSVSASQDQTTWVLTSYIVGAAVMTPLSGWLSHKIGRKALLLISVAGFISISILCGLATNLPELVLFRFLQGMSGAALLPLTQATLYDMWPMRLIPRVVALYSAAVMVGPIFGPIIGGFLTEQFSWRWVFYINLPIGAVSFAAVLLGMPRDEGGQQRRFDLLGFAAVVVGSVGLQLMLDRGPGEDWFDSREICIWATSAACAFYVFVAHMATARNPLFRTSLFRDWNYLSGLAFLVVVQATLFSTLAVIPTLMQTLLGYSALQSGLAVMPRGVGSLLGFGAAPWLAARFGPRRTVAVGVLLAAFALYEMARFDLSMTVDGIRFTGFLQGFSQGLMFNPISVLSFANLAPAIRVDASVFSNMIRSLGMSVGIALLQSQILRYNAVAHERLAAGVAASDPMVRSTLPGASGWGAEALAAVNAEVTRQASMMSYDTIFAWMSLGTLLLLPLLVVMRQPGVRREPLQEIHADQA